MRGWYAHPGILGSEVRIGEGRLWCGMNLVGEPPVWRRRVEEFVLGRVGVSPARVLEVGCGAGELARALDRAGHAVTAIDPHLPVFEREAEGPDFREVGIEGFSEPGPFDHVVAILSLHHVEDLSGAVDKMAGLLRAGGSLVVIEFAWDRLDGNTAGWALERLPETPPPEHTSWLEHCCGAPRGVPHEGGEGHHPATHENVAGWAREHGLHDSRLMREALARRFAETLFEWGPYLYSELDDTSEADELVAIEAQEINATGFRYVGITRASAGS
jgi:SAM-dependent methyltransferase